MIRCPKCHAAATNLELRREYLAAGTELQTVRCILCGERRSRTVQRPYQRRAFHSGYSAAERQRHQSRIAAHIQAHQAVCCVEGCTATYYTKRSKLKMCKHHGELLRRWLYGAQTTPAPLINTGGRWIENPAREEAAHAHA